MGYGRSGKIQSYDKTILQRTQGVIIVFDLTKRETFDNLPKWIVIKSSIYLWVINLI